MQDYIELVSKWLITSGLQITLIIILMIIALKSTNIIIEKLFNKFLLQTGDIEGEKRSHTLKHISKSVSQIIIFTITVITILGKVGIDIGPILAAAGVLGIAVGFGARRFVEDIISGFLILLDDQIRVGDVVEICDKSGLVEKVDLKMVVLRDISGNVHYIRNGKIDVITNMTKDYSCYVADISISYKENVARVIEIIKKVDEELRTDSTTGEDILAPIEVLGLDRFEESAVIIKARLKTKPCKQWAIGREFNKRLKNKFDELNVEIPFPQRTLHIEEKK